MKRRWICLLLTALMLIQLAPAAALADGAEGGRFVFAAAKAGQVIIAPTYFAYEAGQTVHDVLLYGSHGHSFIEQSSGFINVIDGVEGNFNRCDDRGGFDMDVPASSVKAFFFVSSDLVLTAESAGTFSTMLAAMAEFNTAGNGLGAYAPAANAYRAAENALLGAPSDYAALAEALSSAMKDYEENVLNAGALPLKLRFETDSGAALTEYRFTADDSYGNTYTFTQADEEIALPQRDYFFTLSSGANSARGSMTVKADGESGAVSIGGAAAECICLHDGAPWIGEVILHATSGGDPVSDAFPAENDTYFIPDTASSAYLWLGKGAGLDGETHSVSSVKVFPVYRRADGVYKTGAEPNEKRTWESRYDALTKVIAAGTEGNTVVLEARFERDGYTQVESRTLTIRRSPTLAALTVTADGAAQSIGFAPAREGYALTVSSDTVTVAAECRSGDGYSVSAAGTVLSSGEAKEISLTGTETVIPVIVSLNGLEKTYTLTVTRVNSVAVTVTHDEDAAVEIRNAAGAEMGDVNGSYALVPGERYTCIATKNEYYHASVVFTAAEGLSIAAPVPQTDDRMSAMALRSGTKANTSAVYLNAGDFRAETHSYTVEVPDTQSNLYAAVCPARGTVTAVEAGITVKATAAGSIDSAAAAIRNYLKKGPAQQTLTFRVSETDGTGVTQYQDYVVTFRRTLSLSDLSLTVEGEVQTIYAEGTSYPGFDTEYDRYTADIVRAAAQAALTVTPYGDNYYVTVNDERYDLPQDGDGNALAEEITAPLTLDHDKDEETFTITVCCSAEGAVSGSVTLTLRKRDAVRVAVLPTDAESGEPIPGALPVVYDSLSGERIWPGEDGCFPLVESLSYRVVCTCYGYAGQSMEFTAAAESAELTVSMRKAPAQVTRPSLDSSWPSFRGSDDANGVVEFKTPILPENAMLSWASKLGEGYSSAAVSCPILITEDGYEYLIVYASDCIYKVDAILGKTVAVGQMDHSSSFAINSPTYAEGMIFVGLANGTVQAFDASTLESLWIYHDARGGQPNCPITYSGGYIYTGFWNSETTPANYVCLSVTDEDTGRGDEEKLATWTHTDKGFYWAGCYVDPDRRFLLVGTDDGDPGYLEYTARLLCLDPVSGKLLDTVDGIRGDLRSNVSYDKVTDRYFFTSKGGYFYSTKMTESNGLPCFDKAAYREIYLDNYGSDPSRPPMSTCTPVVYGSRAYIGVSGVGQFTPYSGHNITVIDLNTWKTAYSVPTQGYPQTSGLLTTAYEKENGYVYVYFFDNFTPGKLRVLQDKAGQTAPVVTTPETYSDKGKETLYQTPYVLFTPAGEQEQYAICSPISDVCGTIYFKNDSAHLMALSNTVTGMEVVTPPNRTEYTVGEHFDPAGMEIKLSYSNGMKRTLPVERMVNGVTIRYFDWDDRTDGLRASDSEFFIRFAAYMYQDEADSETGTVTPGRPVASPEAALRLTVMEEAKQITEVRLAGESVCVALDGYSKAGTQMFAAGYEENGRLLCMTVLTVREPAAEVSMNLPGSAAAARIRVFVTDDCGVPLTESADWVAANDAD